MAPKSPKPSSQDLKGVSTELRNFDNNLSSRSAYTDRNVLVEARLHVVGVRRSRNLAKKGVFHSEVTTGRDIGHQIISLFEKGPTQSPFQPAEMFAHRERLVIGNVPTRIAIQTDSRF